MEGWWLGAGGGGGGGHWEKNGVKSGTEVETVIFVYDLFMLSVACFCEPKGQTKMLMNQQTRDLI